MHLSQAAAAAAAGQSPLPVALLTERHKIRADQRISARSYNYNLSAFVSVRPVRYLWTDAGLKF